MPRTKQSAVHPSEMTSPMTEAEIAEYKRLWEWWRRRCDHIGVSAEDIAEYPALIGVDRECVEEAVNLLNSADISAINMKAQGLQPGDDFVEEISLEFADLTPEQIAAIGSIWQRKISPI